MGFIKRTIDAVKPPKTGRKEVWDGDLPGFGLRVYYTGKKVYIAKYRLRDDGKHQLMTLGDAKVLTIAQARTAYKAVLADVAEGKDPQGERRAAKSQEKPLTFAELADLWMDDHAKPHRRTWKEDERRLRAVTAKLGTKKAAGVTTRMLSRIHQDIGDKRGKTEANRTITTVRAVFGKAVTWKDLPRDFDNPASGVDLYPEPRRTRIVRRAEFPGLLAAIKDYGDPIVAGALLTLVFTGLRKRDVLNLQWSDVDMEAGLIALRMQKTSDVRLVAMSASTTAVFTSLPRFEGNPYVFPGRIKGKPLQSLKKAWTSIRTTAGCPDLWMHDLKRTVGTMLALAGESNFMISQVLGHRDESTARHYVSLAAEMTSGVMDRYATQVEEAGVPRVLPGELNK
jgi:integrase